MFIGREQELGKLNEMYASEKYEMAVIYGRRRVGKSELINHFCKGKKAVFFTAVENTEAHNLNILVESILKAHHTTTIPRDFLQALDLITEIARNEKLIFVIDEYPYLAKSAKYFSSLLQRHIDNYFSKTNCMIILCGSSMSFMENQVLGYKSPLYGRRTAQFKIEPFNYIETAKFVPNYSREDKLLTYGIFGGTPFYLAQIDSKKSLQENVQKLFFTNGGLLLEEPASLIKQELREPLVYNGILTAIANGSTRLSEISARVNKPTNQCDIYLKNLISLGLVYREKPLDEKSSTKSLYVISDNMFRFWFRYVQDNMSLITRGFGGQATESIWPKLSEYMGKAFEDICIQYLWENYNNLPLQPQGIGRWWGNNPVEKREDEIDIVATQNDSALFAECKYTTKPIGIDYLAELERKSNLFKKTIANKYFYFFGKSGFTEQLIQKSKENKNIKLIDLSDLI